MNLLAKYLGNLRSIIHKPTCAIDIITLQCPKYIWIRGEPNRCSITLFCSSGRTDGITRDIPLQYHYLSDGIITLMRLHSDQCTLNQIVPMNRHYLSSKGNGTIWAQRGATKSTDGSSASLGCTCLYCFSGPKKAWVWGINALSNQGEQVCCSSELKWHRSPMKLTMKNWGPMGGARGLIPSLLANEMFWFRLIHSWTTNKCKKYDLGNPQPWSKSLKFKGFSGVFSQG